VGERPLERIIAAILKVPPQPEPPMGSPGSVRVFNAAPGFYRYRVSLWAISQTGTALGLVVGLVILRNIEMGPLSWAHGFVIPLEILGVAVFLAQMPVTFLLIGLDYRYRWYMVTDTSLRIREGLLTVREQTMTFANIQNLSIRQGPLQRLLGIADLRVRTAGGGGGEGSGGIEAEKSGSTNMHLAYFRGVDNASEIRDGIMGRMLGLKDSGLGNPDEQAKVLPMPAQSFDGSRALLSAAHELLAETRLLRAALEG
jgi:membrane protein YdbS with pleckstrin-like domain